MKCSRFVSFKVNLWLFYKYLTFLPGGPAGPGGPGGPGGPSMKPVGKELPSRVVVRPLSPLSPFSPYKRGIAGFEIMYRVANNQVEA